MKSLLRGIALTGVLFTSSVLFAKGENDGLAILKKVIKRNKTIKGYTAVVETTQATGQTTKMRMSMRRNDDNKTISMRMTPINTPVNMVMILNKEGFWSILKNKAIKLSYLSPAMIDTMTGNKQMQLKDGSTYSVEDGEVNGVKCFIITATFSEKGFKEVTQDAIKLLPENIKKMAETGTFDMTLFVPKKIIYAIGKKDFFTRGITTFNKKNVQIQKMTYSNLHLNVVLDKKLFEIPKNLERKEAKSILEFTQLMRNDRVESIMDSQPEKPKK